MVAVFELDHVEVVDVLHVGARIRQAHSGAAEKLLV
jgi:hypothetical protein